MTKYVCSRSMLFVEQQASDSNPGEFHNVMFGPNLYDDSIKQSTHPGKNDWSCDCNDWIYRRQKSGGYCKHIERVILRDRGCNWTDEKPLIFESAANTLQILLSVADKYWFKSSIDQLIKALTDKQFDFCQPFCPNCFAKFGILSKTLPILENTEIAVVDDNGWKVISKAIATPPMPKTPFSPSVIRRVT